MLFGGLQGLQVKKGQILGYIEQLGTFVEIKVSCGHHLLRWVGWWLLQSSTCGWDELLPDGSHTAACVGRRACVADEAAAVKLAAQASQ